MTSFESGKILFKVAIPPAGRQRIALFSEGTEDPNPIHVDEDFARKAGFPTVLQQGPMTTAHFARLFEETVGAARLKLMDITFTAPVYPEDKLVLCAEVTEVGDVIHCSLIANKLDGTITARGYAEFAV